MDKAAYEEMKKNSLKYVKEKFDYQDMADKYTALLTSEYNRFHKKRRGV